MYMNIMSVNQLSNWTCAIICGKIKFCDCYVYFVITYFHSRYGILNTSNVI